MLSNVKTANALDPIIIVFALHRIKNFVNELAIGTYFEIPILKVLLEHFFHRIKLEYHSLFISLSILNNRIIHGRFLFIELIVI